MQAMLSKVFYLLVLTSFADSTDPLYRPTPGPWNPFSTTTPEPTTTPKPTTTPQPTTTPKPTTTAKLIKPCWSGDNNLLQCVDGTELPILPTNKYWPSCSKHGGRGKCPVDWPYMCAGQTYLDGSGFKDYWCKKTYFDCGIHSGLRPCPTTAVTTTAPNTTTIFNPCAPVSSMVQRQFDANTPRQGKDSVSFVVLAMASLALVLVILGVAVAYRQRKQRQSRSITQDSFTYLRAGASEHASLFQDDVEQQEQPSE